MTLCQRLSKDKARQRVLRRATTAIRRRSRWCARAPSRSASRCVVGDRRLRARRRVDVLRRRCCSTRRPTATSHDYAAVRRRASTRAGALVVVAADLLALDAAHAAGRARRRHRGRHRAALRRADGLRRPARGVPRDARTSSSARCPGRIVGVSQDAHGKPALPPRAADARAAHPPREGDEQHLHRAGAARGHGGDVRRLPRARGAAAHRARACTRSTAIARGGPAAARLRRRRTRRSSTRSASTLDGERGRRSLDAARERAASTCARSTTTRVGIALDETTTRADVEALLARVRRRRRGASRRRRAGASADATLPAALRAHARSSCTHPVFNTLPLRDTRCCATCTASQTRTSSLDRIDDPARLVHDEAQRDERDDAGDLARVRRAASRSRRPTRRRATAQLFERARGAGSREITGFAAVSLQPNAGSQGEYAGLLVDPRATTRAAAKAHRDVCLIPASAHGTNPASAVMAGMQVVVVACDAQRQRRPRRPARARPQQHARRPRRADGHLSRRRTACSRRASARSATIVHEHGGQVYMDGANMNAQVGLCRAGRLRRRRLPPQPAQDLLHPARRRRPGHGPDRRRRAPRAVPAGPSAWSAVGGAERSAPVVGGAVGQRRASCRSRGCTSR